MSRREEIDLPVNSVDSGPSSSRTGRSYNKIQTTHKLQINQRLKPTYRENYYKCQNRNIQVKGSMDVEVGSGSPVEETKSKHGSKARYHYNNCREPRVKRNTGNGSPLVKNKGEFDSKIKLSYNNNHVIKHKNDHLLKDGLGKNTRDGKHTSNINNNNNKYNNGDSIKNRKKISKTNVLGNKSNANQLLKELLLFEKSEDANNIKRIISVFSNFEADITKDMCMLDIIDTLKKICSETKTFTKSIINCLCHQTFLKTLQTFMLQKLKELAQTEEGQEKCNSFIRSFIQLSNIAIELLPAKDLMTLKNSIILIRSVVIRMGGKINLKEEDFNFQNMMALINEKVIKEELEGEEVSSAEINQTKMMSVLPTYNDLFGESPQLKKNIVEGAYKSVEHYLTVQFKLLHEDFVAPLREGITDYLNHGGLNRRSGIVVYKNVKIIKASIESGRLGHVIKLDTKIKWEIVSKFFIFGSLLMFTINNFNTFFLGTVIEVNNKNETIVVKLNGSHNKVCENIYEQDFVMAASKVFFEPYFHVLTALQNIKDDEFPMEKYIIQVDPSTKLPAYISELGLSTYKIYEQEQVNILDPVWPKFTSVTFNDSQSKAFQAALTNEFVAIQGPPGTGKTFLGQQLVKTLLSNVKIDTPILVVCYKNHALDQFLEGFIEGTCNVVRIGGQSKNKGLEKLNLKNRRGEYGYHNYECILETLVKEYLRAQYYFYGLKKHGIVSVKNVLPYILCPKFKEELLNSDYEEWLLEGVYIDDEIDILEEYDNENLNNMYNDQNEIIGVDNSVENEFDITFQMQNDEQHKLEDVSSKSSINLPVILQETMRPFEQTFTDDFSDIYEKCKQEIESENQEHNLGKSETRYSTTPKSEFVITIRSLKTFWNFYESEINSLINIIYSDEDKYLYEKEREHMILAYRNNIEDIKAKIPFIKRMLSRNFNLSQCEIEKVYKLGQHSIWSLTTQQRWALYHSWLNDLAKDIKKNMVEIEEAIRSEEKHLENARNAADLKILQSANLVGLTTTGAAKLRPMLNELGAKIVIIEEAAEVLESHIVAAISDKCQHLILIGDHKQLRPNPAVYKLCRKYNFDVSLFERMVKNGLNCHTLNVQHRMRPEFASLIVPAIYPTLQNHRTVYNRPPIKGVNHNIFFINHKNPEEQPLESLSHRNVYEAKYVVEFAKYLLLQGYASSAVTILATYSGQVKLINKLIEKHSHSLRDVRVSTVDDFQGEENIIIILSLVRNNEEKSIGFLKIENRVCVALSRARDGLFIIGNMELLTENSDIWPKIKDSLLEVKALGNSFSTYCQNHPETVRNVVNGFVFEKYPEGGCHLKCQIPLNCGHACKYHCHPRDQTHEAKYSCTYKCERKICTENHPCPLKCGQKCKPCLKPVKHLLACGHFEVAACSYDSSFLKCTTNLPCMMPCGHEGTKLCSETTVAALLRKGCSQICSLPLACNHSCVERCTAPHVQKYVTPVWLQRRQRAFLPKNQPFHTCTTVCDVKVEVTLKCDHVLVVECNKVFPDSKKQLLICDSLLEKLLSCGHTNSVPCYLYNFHETCETIVEKTLNCGHSKKIKCSESIDCVSCEVKMTKTLKCGHEMKAKCFEPIKSLICQNVCTRLLSCGHQCELLCSVLCKCTMKLKKILPSCGHSVSYKCGSEENVLCNQLVLANIHPDCGHGPVTAPCHYNSAVLTSEETSIASKLSAFCKFPCKTMLKCGHVCSGNCSDCRKKHTECKSICNKGLPCGHKCQKKCKVKCLPCYNPCLNRCSHSKCEGICGENCTPCQEPCTSQCVHTKCTRPCSSFCNRQPCNRPCPKRLVCDHPCIGFCGETCPKQCLQCDPQFFLPDVGGNGLSRYIALEDCGHTVNATLLDRMFYKNSTNIVKCPVRSCEQPVISTNRYRNQVRKIFMNIRRDKKYKEAKTIALPELTKEKPQYKGQRRTNMNLQERKSLVIKKKQSNRTIH